MFEKSSHRGGGGALKATSVVRGNDFDDEAVCLQRLERQLRRSESKKGGKASGGEIA